MPFRNYDRNLCHVLANHLRNAQLGEMVLTSPGLVFPTRRLEKHSPGLVSLTPQTAQYETVDV